MPIIWYNEADRNDDEEEKVLSNSGLKIQLDYEQKRMTNVYVAAFSCKDRKR